ncbi:MAG: hypothetical protein ACREV1_12975 [Gammaproteobacteria bacterium]
MVHQVARQLPQFEAYFTPYYCDGFIKLVCRTGLLDFTVMGGQFLQQTLKYLETHRLALDIEGGHGPYDLVVTCSDLIVPRNLLGTKLVLVQEGMTDPETLAFHLVKVLKLPRWIAHTAATGLSDLYDIFCVASDGYRDLFIRKGVRPDKIRVTGIPNFDDCASFLRNDFPYRDYVLVATSDRRETYNYENRRRFIYKANGIAAGRQIIFKFHPNENAERARREVERYSPGALSFSDGNTDHMIANCKALITRFSSVVYVAAALAKEVHCDLPANEVKRLLPIQNGGRSAANIANECLALFG